MNESLFARRKYNNGHGRAVTEQWVFGGYDSNTKKKSFLVPVDTRDPDKLLPIIQEWVAPGTTYIVIQQPPKYRVQSPNG